MKKKKPGFYCPSCALPSSVCGHCGKERKFLDSATLRELADTAQLHPEYGKDRYPDPAYSKAETHCADAIKYAICAVSHPKHYNTGKIEVCEFIEDQRLGFHLGNVVKYVCRAGRKDKATRVQDLEKAVWYLRRKIELLQAKAAGRDPKRPNDMSKRGG